MSLFKNILNNLDQKIKENNSKNQDILMCINTVLKTSLTDTNLDIKNKVLIIKTSPTIKMALLLKKDQILLKLKQEGIDIISIN